MKPTKFTIKDIKEIQKSTEKGTKLAKKYHVTESWISRIRNKHALNHLVTNAYYKVY